MFASGANADDWAVVVNLEESTLARKGSRVQDMASRLRSRIQLTTDGHKV